MKMIDVAEVSELAKDQMGRVDEKIKARRFPDKNERVNQRPVSASQKRRDERDSCYRRHRQGYRGTQGQTQSSGCGSCIDCR
jgi:hypothetical protein